MSIVQLLALTSKRRTQMAAAVARRCFRVAYMLRYKRESKRVAMYHEVANRLGLPERFCCANRDLEGEFWFMGCARLLIGATRLGNIGLLCHLVADIPRDDIILTSEPPMQVARFALGNAQPPCLDYAVGEAGEVQLQQLLHPAGYTWRTLAFHGDQRRIAAYVPKTARKHEILELSTPT